MTSFSGKKIVITGGLGFLGSSLAVRLSWENAKITIIDNLAPLYGANYFNLNQAKRKNINVIIGDIRDKDLIKNSVKKAAFIFHFAAQVSYIDSLNMPFDDLELNVTGTLNILETLRNHNRQARLFFASSRMVLGPATQTRINEEHPAKPISIYGIHKLTSENYLLTYHKNFGIGSTILRITNPYGPRQQIKHSKYSLIGWFIRRAMENKAITIFGSGRQKRDYIYIDDIVDAIILLAKKEKSVGEIYNVGFGKSTEFRAMVKKIIEVIGKGRIVFSDWPDDYEKIETGNIQIDTSKIFKLTRWKPRVGLENGIRRTYRYYAKYFGRYAG
jgi:UDP-glucose 4-epimerase